MSLETATYIDSLVVSNPDGTDQRSTADDHLRLIKACLKRSFPLLASPVSASGAAVSFVNDLSASAQAQLNTLREGSATANAAVNARFANSASAAAAIKSLSGTYSVDAANVPDLSSRSNTFSANISGVIGSVVFSGTVPGFLLHRTGAAADEGYWRVVITSGGFALQGVSDDGNTANGFLVANRSGVGVSDISITCSGTVYVNGFDVLSPPELNGVAAASYARLDIAQTFAKGAGSTIVALVADGSGIITPNCEDGNVFRIFLTGNRTMAAPSNPRSGQTIVFHILQNAGGGNTLAWNSIYKFAGSTDPTLTTAGSARDVFAFNYDSTSDVWAQAGLNVG